MKVYPLNDNERASTGFTHRINITHEDLTETTANTAQTIAIFTVAAGDYVADAAVAVTTKFEDASDNAFNATTVIVGDDGNDDRYIASQEVNANGSFVLYGPAVNSTVKYAYLAANTVDIKFGSMAAKSLSDIDVGELDVFLSVIKLPSYV
jgi:hypothetical protein